MMLISHKSTECFRHARRHSQALLKPFVELLPLPMYVCHCLHNVDESSLSGFASAMFFSNSHSVVTDGGVVSVWCQCGVSVV